MRPKTPPAIKRPTSETPDAIPERHTPDLAPAPFRWALSDTTPSQWSVPNRILSPGSDATPGTSEREHNRQAYSSNVEVTDLPLEISDVPLASTDLGSYRLNPALARRMQDAVASDEGFYEIVGRRFAQVKGVGWVQVEFDATAGAYRATDMYHKLAPGPILYKNADEPTWSPRSPNPSQPSGSTRQLPSSAAIEGSGTTKKPEGYDGRKVSESDSDSESVNSDVSTSEEYPVYNDLRVLKTNPYQATLALPAGSYFNNRGMIERTDIETVYRVESLRRFNRRELPHDSYFRTSNFFGGISKMLDGPVVIASRSRKGAELYSKEFGKDYVLFEISCLGIPVVSLRENVHFNAAFTALRDGWHEDYIPSRIKENNTDDIAEGGYAFDEVHVANDRLGSSRIRILHPADY